jgi:hypothetical protein
MLPGAQAEVEKTLRALAGRFQVHADSAQASRQVASDSRLRAELSPVGEYLALRLVVTPLGPDGPRLPAGQRPASPDERARTAKASAPNAT